MHRHCGTNNRAIYTSVGHNTAKFYDMNIFVTVVCIFLPEFGSKTRYFALHPTENVNVF